ncbi:MAG: hypothetical protein AAGF11_53970 [Myxococcota bacterium]
MSWPLEPDQIHGWESGPNRTRIARLSRHVIGVELVGSIPVEGCMALEPWLEHYLPDSGAAHLFWNAHAMKDYDPSLRWRFQKILSRHRAEWEAMHVLFTSVFVGMITAAVNLTYGGGIRMHRDPVAFDAALERTLAVQ